MLKLERLIQNYDLDCILLVNEGNPVNYTFRYFTGLFGLYEDSYFIYDGEPKLLVRKLEIETAKRDFKGKVIENSKENLEMVLRGMEKVGTDLRYLSARKAKELEKKFELVDLSKEFEKMREIKSEEEIRRIKKAVEISRKTLEELIERDLRKMSEREILSELIYLALKNGAHGFSFDPIVACDANASEPHYNTPGKRKPKKVLLVDFGVYYKGYTSDITRTFVFHRSMLPYLEDALEAQERAIERLREGENGANVDKAANEIVRRYHEPLHRTGHMIGLEVHEGRSLNEKSTLKLGKGMVFAVEPGIYLKGVGGFRIEDNVVVDRRPRNLSKFLKGEELLLY